MQENPAPGSALLPPSTSAMSNTPTHNLPQQRFAQQMQDWKPLAAFREALRAGDILEALRLNTFLGLTQETVAAHQALLLLWIEDMEWWQHPTGGYGPWESFAECATTLTGRGRSTCGDLVRNWRWWRERQQAQEQWIRHCQLIGWAACREIRRADIPAAEIETVVEAISPRPSQTAPSTGLPGAVQAQLPPAAGAVGPLASQMQPRTP